MTPQQQLHVAMARTRWKANILKMERFRLKVQEWCHHNGIDPDNMSEEDKVLWKLRWDGQVE